MPKLIGTVKIFEIDKKASKILGLKSSYSIIVFPSEFTKQYGIEDLAIYDNGNNLSFDGVLEEPNQTTVSHMGMGNTNVKWNLSKFKRLYRFTHES